MHAIVVRNPAGAAASALAGSTPPALEWTEVPDPAAGRGDLLVEVRAAGLNRADLLQAMGRYPPPPGESEILGLEVAGEVVEVGPGTSGRFRPGDRVMALLGGGGYAERARVAEDQAMPIPAGMSFAEAAAVPEAFLTAWLNLFRIGKLAPDEALIVHAAASGVGTAALQLARGVAGVVLATASEAKLEACRGFGATHVLAREQVAAHLADTARAATGGAGANVVLDLVGGAYLQANVAALALHGRLCCVGTLAGAQGNLDLRALLGRRLSILGSTLRTRTAGQKASLVAEFSAQALPRFEAGALRPVLARTFPFEQASAAHALLAAGGVVGKVVLST